MANTNLQKETLPHNPNETLEKQTLPQAAGETPEAQKLLYKNGNSLSNTVGGFFDRIRNAISKLFNKTSRAGSTPSSSQNTGLTGQGLTGSSQPAKATATPYGDYISTAEAQQQAVDVKKAATTAAPQNTTPTAGVYGAEIAKQSTQPAAQPTNTQPAQQSEKQAMTYEEYIKTMQDGFKKDLDNANREAEIAKQRATVDAQNAYEQNKAGYGANAETLAGMGLQGGGYSDYLASQGYAQKRADMQKANANEILTKAQNQATYQEYIRATNEKLAEKMLYDERLADQRAYDEAQLDDQRKYNEEQQAAAKKENLYTSLWEGVQDLDTGYTAEAITELGKEYGLSDAQIKTLTDLLKATKDKQKDQIVSSVKDVIAENGGVIDDDIKGTLEDLGVDKETIEEITQDSQQTVSKNYEKQISSYAAAGDAASLDVIMSQLDIDYQNGSISQTDYQKHYGTYHKYNTDGVISFNYNGNYNTKLQAMLDQKAELKTALSTGKISQDTYNSLIGSIDSKNSNSCSGGWYIQGLGSGGEDDDIDLTIGSTSRDKGKEYDLLCGGQVTDSALIAELNRIATGDKSKAPAVGSGWLWLKGDNANSKDTAGKLVVAYGDMYIYGQNGWRIVKDDNDTDTVKNAVRDFLSRTTTTQTQATKVSYPSDSEIAAKAQNKTLTYNDVAKYNAGIRTKSEFARGNNSDKQKYGDYQTYLNAMYEKYKK